MHHRFFSGLATRSKRAVAEDSALAVSRSDGSPQTVSYDQLGRLRRDHLSELSAGARNEGGASMQLEKALPTRGRAVFACCLTYHLFFSFENDFAVSLL